MKNTTLCYIRKDDEYLVIHRTKKENDLNKDKWIGVGGKFLPGETPEQCMLREAKEETGLTVRNLKYCGMMHWHNTDTNDKYFVHFYKTTDYTGELIEKTDEGEVFFSSIEDLKKMELSPNFSEYLKMFFSDEHFEIFCNWNEEMKKDGEPEWNFQYK